jgi:hypothetical protein
MAAYPARPSKCDATGPKQAPARAASAREREQKKKR